MKKHKKHKPYYAFRKCKINKRTKTFNFAK